MKYSRLERLKIERADNEDDWFISFCASHIFGCAPVLWVIPSVYAWLAYPIYTILFMIFWKRKVLK